MLQKKTDRSFLETAQKGMEEWSKLMDEQAARTDKPMKPQVVAHELASACPTTPSSPAIRAPSPPGGPGTFRQARADALDLREPGDHGCGLPYAIAAQVAYPDRQCVAFVGDGGFSMLMAEFATAVKYKLPIKVVVIKNNTLGQIKWEQMVFLGNPEYGCDLQPIDFAAFARACGGTGFTIEDPTECGNVLDEALAVKGPVIIEAVVDPFEPPMPPKATVEAGL